MAKRGLYYDLVRQQEKHSVPEEIALPKFEQHTLKNDNNNNSEMYNNTDNSSAYNFKNFADSEDNSVPEVFIPKSKKTTASNSSESSALNIQNTADSKNVNNTSQKHRSNMNQG